MKKSSKIILTISILIPILILMGIGIYLSIGKEQKVIGGDSIDFYSMKLIEDTSDYTSYRLDFQYLSPTQPSSCNQLTNSQPFYQQINSYTANTKTGNQEFPELKDNLYLNTYFNVSEIGISPITATTDPCVSPSQIKDLSNQVTYSNTQTKCKIINAGTTNGIPRINMDCIFDLNLNLPQQGVVYGIQNGYAIVKIPKKNAPKPTPEPPIVVITTPDENTIPEEQKLNYYRFENNQCNLMSLYSSEKTSKDYLSMSDCQAKILTCVENWQCTDWSICTSSSQTRQCTDANNCNATSSKPALLQSCSNPVPACNPDWTCTEWSDCINNQQTRNCLDNNNCGTTSVKPSLNQGCSIMPIQEPIPEQVNFWNTKTLDLENLYWIIISSSIVILFIVIFIILIAFSKKRR